MFNFQFFPSLILRSPALSYQYYDQEDIQILLDNAFFKSAIYLASKSLYKEIEKKGFEYNELNEKQRISIKKYINRMSFRPTPFGLFAAVSTAGWGQDNQLNFQQEGDQVHLQFSQSFTNGLARKVFLPELEKYQKYQSNSTIYRVNNEFRYIKTKKEKGADVYQFTIESVEYKSFISEVLTFCEKEKVREAIISLIIEKTGSDWDGAEAFFYSLLNSQLIKSSLEPNITGSAYFQRLQDLCAANKISSLKLDQLEQLNNKVKNYDRVKSKYSMPDAFHQDLPQLTPDSWGVLPFYVNYERKNIQGSLNDKHQETIRQGLYCLNMLCKQQNSPSLNKFISSFKKKFENRIIPLLHVLDPEVGIGYDNLTSSIEEPALVENIRFKNKGAANKAINWSPVHALLLERWKSTSGKKTVVLTETDIRNLPENLDDVSPPTMSVIFRVIDNKVLLEEAGGTSALTLMGRFTPLNQNILTSAKKIAECEEKNNPDVLFAEILHLSDEHTDNINRRECIRKYEIPITAQSCREEKYRIALSDLWVTVAEDRIVLWSKQHQKIVIPRLSSAYNFKRDDLVIFRFLCDLQYQGIKSNLSLDLSRFFPDLSFYPRIEYGSAILCLATWHVKKEELQHVVESPLPCRFQLFREFAASLEIPRYFSLTHHDNQLVFDSEKETEVLFFLELVKKIKSLTIKEFLSLDEQNPLLTNEQQKPYVNQFIANLYNNQTVYPAIGLRTYPFNKPEKVRKFVPGSKWLYLKIYCHSSRSNDILCKSLLPVIKPLIGENINQWFFVRYNDPEHHIRLRLEINPGTPGKVLSNISERISKLVKNGIVQNFQTEIYERELERYGIELIEDIEGHFNRSSVLIAGYIQKGLDRKNKYSYYSLAFISVNQILQCFMPSNEDKFQFLEQLYGMFFREHEGEKSLRVDLDLKYREMRSEIEEIINDKGYFRELRLGSVNTDLLKGLKSLKQKVKSYPSSGKNQLIADIIHMHLNRLFIEDARKQELVVYFSLYKYYQSVIARSLVN